MRLGGRPTFAQLLYKSLGKRRSAKHPSEGDLRIIFIAINQSDTIDIPYCGTMFSILQRTSLCRAAHLLRHKRTLHIVKYGDGTKKNRCTRHRFFIESE